MKELNEDIDQLFREVIEPAEMQPSQSVWSTVDSKLDKTQYAKLQKRYGRIFNFSIGVSVVVISLVFLILNQNFKKIDIPVENSNKSYTPSSITAVVEPNETETTAPENKTQKKNNSVVVNENANLSSSPANKISEKVKAEIQNSENNLLHSKAETPVTSSADNGLPAGSANNASVTKPNEEDFNVEANKKENKKTEAEEVVKKADDALKPTVEGALVLSAEIQKGDTENKTETENAKPLSVTPGAIHESIDKTVVSEVPVKESGEKENNNSGTTVSSEDNVLSAAANNSAENAEDIKKEEVLNSAPIASATESKTEEVKNTALPSDSVSETKAANDTASVASAETEKNPLNALIPMKDFKFYLAGFYSPDKLLTTLIDLNSKTSSMKEVQHFAYSTGLKFGYMINKKWSLSTAVVYSAVSNSFETHKQFEIDDDEEFSEIPNQLLVTSYGTVEMQVDLKKHHVQSPEEEKFNWDIEGTQKLKYISVPLECQYTLGKNRFTGFIALGFTSHFLVSQKTTITELNTGTEYNPSIEGLKKAYFGASLGIGIQYRIWQRLSVFIEPTYRQAITSMDGNVPIKTYPSVFGVSGGLAFHF